MKPSERDYKLYLDDMLNSMQRIKEYLGDLEFQEFRNHFMVVDAIIRNFQIIGEASKNIPKIVKEKYPEIPWKKMYGLRNLIDLKIIIEKEGQNKRIP